MATPNGAANDHDDDHSGMVDRVDIDKIAQEVLTPTNKAASASGRATGAAGARAARARFGAGNAGVKKDAMAALYPIDMNKLPCTRDRMCVLGCLAGVLSSGGTARFPTAKKQRSAPSDDNDNDGDANNEKNNNKDTTTARRDVNHVPEPAGGGGDDEPATGAGANADAETRVSRDSSSVWNLFKDDSARQSLMNTTFRNRAVEVNKEMLEMVAELLLLDKSAVEALVPLLSTSYLQVKDNYGSSNDNDKTNKNEKSGTKTPATSRAAATTSSSDEQKGGNKHAEDLRVRHQQELMRPFLDELSVGSGIASIALLLFRLLLTSVLGYDARVRTAFREVAVQVLAHDSARLQMQLQMQMAAAGTGTANGTANGNGNEKQPQRDGVPKKKDYQTALLKFEDLESAIASHLTELAKEQQEVDEASTSKRGSRFFKEKGTLSRKDKLVRAAKVGTVGLAAGTLFAFTGGLAAPAIAAGIATLAGGTAIGITAMAALSSAAAVTTIFGVGGGLLAANKMKRRVKGLTDFTLQRETEDNDLFVTIGIAGWLRDDRDFQRSWGVTPNDMDDKAELLERFYAIFSPDKVPHVEEILMEFEGREDALWAALADTYGRDPDSLLPLFGPKYEAALSSKELTMVDEVLTSLGYLKPNPNIGSRTGESRSPAFPLSSSRQESDTAAAAAAATSSDTTLVDGEQQSTETNTAPPSSVPMPRPGYPVWDYSAEFGGELYTVEWESKLLLQISDASRKFVRNHLQKVALKGVITYTTLSALMFACSLPIAVLAAANKIDSTWTLACNRADEAGKGLAKTLLEASSGNRPITLIGFSMGARVIYSCLMELGKEQIEWEKRRVEKAETTKPKRDSKAAKAKAAQSSDEAESESDTPSREPASIVQDVILMGLPYHLDKTSWEACRQVVAGRLVNCYIPKDLVLLYLFNVNHISTDVLSPVCGTSPVRVPGVENYNVKKYVTGHNEYCGYAGEVLRHVQLNQPNDLEDDEDDADDDDEATATTTTATEATSTEQDLLVAFPE